VLVPAVSAPTEAPDTETAPPPAHEKVDFLVDLKTGETTPLPKRIRGNGRNGYAISPDGSEVAYSGPAENGGRGREVFVAHLDGTHIRQITHDARAKAPAWSPDGTTIAYVGRPTRHVKSNIFVMDLTSGVTTQVTFESRGVSSSYSNMSPTGIQFSPDGSSIVYTANHRHYDEVRIVPVTGGNGRRLVGGRGSSASGASLSPDGSFLSYICDGHLCLANADGSDPTDAECTQFLHFDSCVIVAGGLSPFAIINTASWSPDGSRLAYMDYGPESVDVIDVTTGETTRVARGAWPRWVDNRTLIVEVCNCPR
jgi:Tol biopolymer transport system component